MFGNPAVGMAVALVTFTSIFLLGMLVRVISDVRHGISLKEALFGDGKYKRDPRPIKRWAIALAIASALAVALILAKLRLMR
jgi:hypothetical protein